MSTEWAPPGGLGRSRGDLGVVVDAKDYAEYVAGRRHQFPIIEPIIWEAGRWRRRGGNSVVFLENDVVCILPPVPGLHGPRRTS